MAEVIIDPIDFAARERVRFYRELDEFLRIPSVSAKSEHDADTACAAVAAGTAQAAFLVQAPSLGQIFEAADAGDRMPQKSTYFKPKLPTGAVLYAFD